MYKMKQDQMLMLVVAFLFGLFFKHISGSVCGGREVEGLSLVSKFEGEFEDYLSGCKTNADCPGPNNTQCCPGGECGSSCP